MANAPSTDEGSSQVRPSPHSTSLVQLAPTRPTGSAGSQAHSENVLPRASQSCMPLQSFSPTHERWLPGTQLRRGGVLSIDGLPDDAQLHRARGIALQRLGNFDHASADFDRALELAPNDPDSYTQCGNLAAERGNFEQAVSDLGQAIAIDANWAEAYRSLAWLHATCPDERFRDPARAVAAAEQAVKLSPPTDCFALDALAVALAEGRTLEQAARWATCAASIAVTRPGAQPSLARREEIEAAAASTAG